MLADSDYLACELAAARLALGRIEAAMARGGEQEEAHAVP